MSKRLRKVKRIALALPLDIVYIQRMVHGVLEFAREQGGWAFTRVPERLSASIEWLRDWSGDGALVSISSRADIRLAASLQIPIVNVSGYFLDARIPTVTLDHQMIGRLAAEHLIARRFCRFGYYGIRGLWYSQQRRIGFRTAVEAAGWRCDVLEGSSLVESPRGSKMGKDDLASWLLSMQPPVGIMASWDLRAAMVIEACTLLGLRVPEDVAVIGVDNDPIACELSVPPLSSVLRDDRQLGRRAAALLSQLVDGKDSPKAPVLIPSSGIVSRRSTETLVIEDSEVAMVVQQIKDHLNEVYGVERILSLTSLSRRQLEHRFRKSVGCSPYAFIIKLRVERAKQLLAELSKKSMTKIAAECGFSELRQFRLVFRRLTGLNPAEYRRTTASAR